MWYFNKLEILHIFYIKMVLKKRLPEVFEKVKNPIKKNSEIMKVPISREL